VQEVSNLCSLGVSAGQLDLHSAASAALDAAGARTAGSYTKWAWSLDRQQNLLAGWTVSVSARGQQGRKNLDSSEKFSLGGPAGVRAYASGEASGDEGWLASLELRYSLTQEISASVFHDSGRVRVNVNPYLNATNHQSRRGSGLGVQGAHGAFDWRAFVAWRETAAGTAEPDKAPRLWFQAGWRF
jgi:hemolysin activation/secretion protein